MEKITNEMTLNLIIHHIDMGVYYLYFQQKS